jgi:hypothetical protein
VRIRIDTIDLVGADRQIAFEPGLNVVLGPISTGKSTLLRLCRILLGAAVEDIPPEVRDNVSALAGRLRIADSSYAVVRPLVATDTAKVEIAGTNNQAWRLPALRRDPTATTTYARWLLERLGLPALDVPMAPTRPAESGTTPVTINDYMLYCHLNQDEIDSSVFGHRDNFKNIKRKYVFEILYGLYDAETASLQESLRETQQELRQLQAGVASFERFLVDTPWENRAVIEARLAEARTHLAAAEDESAAIAGEASVAPRAQQLRERIAELDERLADARAQRQKELRSIEELRQLTAQLETQTARLTRSIVADELLLDFDFKICPRCGADVGPGRGDADRCYLCLQVPAERVSRDDLIREQDRLGAQLEETEQLIAIREARAHDAARQLAVLERERGSVAQNLDAQVRGYVSDQAERIAEAARRREELVGSITQLTDYLTLYAKLDQATRRAETLASQVETILAELEARSARRQVSEQRIDQLESTFGALVEEIGIPRFHGEPRAAINRETYLPIINGRSFAQLSSGGLKVLTNVAHALAHHEAAIELELLLPGLLLLDGVTKNVGRDEYDWARVEAVFHSLIRLSDAYGDELQLIVSANDVPEFAMSYVRLHLSEVDRLIPLPS